MASYLSSVAPTPDSVVPIVPLALLFAAPTLVSVVPTTAADFESWSVTLHAAHWLYGAF